MVNIAEKVQNVRNGQLKRASAELFTAKKELADLEEKIEEIMRVFMLTSASASIKSRSFINARPK